MSLASTVRHARVRYRFAAGLAAWVLVGAALLGGLGVLSVDRFLVAALVGFLVVSALALPDEPTERLRLAVLAAVLFGLGVYVGLAVDRIVALL